jgi:Tol biopolymer transport system component/predicted Ser/Thr protein kinase
VAPERWQRIEALYHAALERDPASRTAFLDGACGQDADLRREVESLLAEAATGEGLLDQAVESLLAEARTVELTPGTRLGPYEIEGLIGQGGMGKVYKARDTRLGRTVAIKTSSARFSQRFEREARAVAALNHPHICHLYDVGPDYLVMEYIEGTPLKGPLPADQASKYAEQILDALDAAHRGGIVHRDLKPGNILVSKQGIKLLDFGLAQMKPSRGDPTITQMTQTGAAIGTPAYMAPEQWEGKQADARSDIYSFGCVLYEMLTGKRASADRVAVAAPLEDILRTCLEKDPDERWQSTRELKHVLGWATEAKPPTTARSRSRTGWIAAGVVTTMAAALAFAHFREKPAEMPVMRLSIAPPEKYRFHGETPPAVSPDGRQLVFAATSDERKSQLWLRPLDSLTARPLPGTENAIYPFWSPNNKSIGFFAAGKLKKMDVSGGPATTLADASQSRGGTWSRDGVIVFAPTPYGGLQQVPASGGVVRPVNRPDTRAPAQRFPWFLPDGRHFLYLSGTGGPGRRSLRIGSLDSPAGDSALLGEADSSAIYAQGHLLFVRGTTLMARPFDAKSLAFTGEEIPVVEQIRGAERILNSWVLSVSSNGVLAYESGGLNTSHLAWLDRAGKKPVTVSDPGVLNSVQLSPDRGTAAVSVNEASNGINIWLYDVLRGLRTRFTFGSAPDQFPVWSQDGRVILFRSNRTGRYDLYRKPADGSRGEELLYADNSLKTPTSFSPDDKYLAYWVQADPKTGDDIWILPGPLGAQGASKPYPFMRTEFNEQVPRFSPDGHWIAYQSNESGRYEVYVAPFPGPGGKRQVSTAGGTQPRWRADGKELFYDAADKLLMAAEVDAKGGTMEVRKVEPLFGPIVDAATGGGSSYDVSADGQRFLILVPEAGETSAPLTVVQNWTAGLKK